MVLISDTVSHELHYLWDKYVTFIIVSSHESRSQMIKIVSRDRTRISRAVRTNQAIESQLLAVSNNSARYNRYSLHEAQYPKPITYDIIFTQASLLGHPGSFFSVYQE